MRKHHLPDLAFDSVAAGYGDSGTVALLLQTQLSKRKVQLRALLDVAAADHPEAYRAAAVDDGYALLAAADSAAPSAAAAVLLEPHVGSWLAHCLRRLRGTADSHVRIANDLAHLPAIAATACVRAGLDVDIELPTGTGGGMALPGLGCAQPGNSGRRRVRVRHASGTLMVGRIRVGPADGPGWVPLRWLTPAGHPRLRVALDDVDPFRDCHHLGAAERIGAADVDCWRGHVGAAWRILVTHHHRYAEALSAGLTSLVPLAGDGIARGMSATSRDAFGSVSMAAPVDGTALAAALVHEFQHAKLGALLDVLPLYDRSDNRLYYAPWRDDPRPLGGLLQGAYAFLGVADFWRVQRLLVGARQATFAHFEFARWRDRVAQVLDVLAASDTFTPAGLRFLAGMLATVDGWRDERVPAEAAALAREAAADHRIGWRLRNLRPDHDQAQVLATAWLNRDEPPAIGDTRVETPAPAARFVQNPRLDLACLRMTDPEQFAGLVTDPAALSREVPAASPGDAAHACGDFAGALSAYRRQVEFDPDATHGWAGLILAAQQLAGQHLAGQHLDPGGEVGPLLVRPEVVYWLHRSLRQTAGTAPDPLTLAGWLATASDQPPGSQPPGELPGEPPVGRPPVGRPPGSRPQ